MFTIKVHSQYKEEVTFKLFLDGVNVQGQLCSADGDVTMRGVNESNTAYRPYTFGEIQVTGVSLLLLYTHESL